MAPGRHGDHGEVELADLVDGPERASVVLRRNQRRPLAVDVDDAGQRNAGQRGENPRVMLAEMADADHRRPHVPPSLSSVFAPSALRRDKLRPTIAMPASLAEAKKASRSKINVLPASIDSTVAPATRIAWMVARPTIGTSKRMS